MEAPRDDLVRANMKVKPELRAEGDSPPVLFGHFSVFSRWYEVDSWEGRFLEQVAPGAYAKTIQENIRNMRVLYDHGYSSKFDNLPLGPIDVLREDGIGAYYEVPLFDTPDIRGELVPRLQAEPPVLGASFRFRVIREEWNDSPGVSAHNPTGIPERTIKEASVAEFGPVTFPASQAATAGVRSKAEFDLWRSLDTEGRADLARLMARASDLGTTNADAAPAGGTSSEMAAPSTTPDTPDSAPPDGLTKGARDRVLRQFTLPKEP